MMGGQAVEQFTSDADRAAAQADQAPGRRRWATADMAELQIAVDKTFIPAQVSGGSSKDPRELGVRVFHAFVDPR